MMHIVHKFLQFIQLNHDFYYYGDQYETFFKFNNAFSLSERIDAVLKHENARLDELMLKSAKQGDFIVQKKELYTGFYTNLKLILTMSKTAQTQIFHLNAADKSLY